MGIFSIIRLGVADSPDKQIDQGIGHGYQIIFAAGMQPVVDGFIHGAHNKTFDETQIKIFSDAAVRLALLDNFGDDVQIHLGHFPDLGLGRAAVLMGFRLIHDGHVPVALKFIQMPADQVAKLVHGIFGLADFFPEQVENLFGLVGKKLHQDVVLIFEIQINRPVRYTGFPCDLGNRGLKKSLICKHLDGSFKDAMIFVTVFIPGTDSGLLPTPTWS